MNRYARMWLDSPRRCQIRFKKYHFAPGVKKNFFFKLHLGTVLFSYFAIIPLEEDVTFHFLIFESPLHKDSQCQVWLKLDEWFLSWSHQCIFYTCLLFPYGKMHDLSIEQKFPLPNNTFCHVWSKLSQRFWRFSSC